MPQLKHGMSWPDHEKDVDANHRKVMKGLHMAGRTVDLLPITRRRRCIQAGGHVGYWPGFLSMHFELVHTFEPDYRAYGCLVENLANHFNVIASCCALGAECMNVNLLLSDICGSSSVSIERSASPSQVRQMAIDDYGFRDVDAILLDIEGGEVSALRGAIETIHRSHPVILIEELNGSTGARELLTSLGYVQSYKKGRDSIFVWQS